MILVITFLRCGRRVSDIGHVREELRNSNVLCLSYPTIVAEFECLILVMHAKRCEIRMSGVCHALLGAWNSNVCYWSCPFKSAECG